jgi:hypothetical protein
MHGIERTERLSGRAFPGALNDFGADSEDMRRATSRASRSASGPSS